MEVAEEEGAQTPHTRARHIKKRALKNKALSVSFDEKDLRDYVGGFHKRKKKRRKVAENQIQEKVRRKRIELRRKRKMDREYVQFGGALPATDSIADECREDDEQDEGDEPIASISGTTTYDDGDVKVTVITSEISHEEDQSLIGKTQAAVPRPIDVAEKKHNITVSKKKPFKRVTKHKSPTMLKKRDKKKTGKKNKRTR